MMVPRYRTSDVTEERVSMEERLERTDRLYRSPSRRELTNGKSA